MLLSGRHQTIKTGKIAGVWFKTKSDSLLSSRQVEAICKRFPNVRNLVPFGGPMIVDLKYMKDFQDVWDEELREKVSFVRFWGYDIQGAIYQTLEGHMLPFILAAGTKELEPDLAAIYIPDQELAAKLEEVESLSPRYQAIKNHEVEPVGCGKCPYCRSQKKLTEIIDYRELNANDKPYDTAGPLDA